MVDIKLDLIAVKDELPKRGEKVLCIGDVGAEMGYFCKSIWNDHTYWEDGDGRELDPIYWARVPSLYDVLKDVKHD